MKKQQNNYAFIDSQNLNLGVSSDFFNKKGKKIHDGWKLDFKRFRIYLRDKYQVKTAFLFIGYKPGNERLYISLQEAGYLCVFKPALVLSDGRIKGNVDAEIVLHAMIEIENYDQAVIVSGDGDFYCLIEHLLGRGKLKKVLVPNHLRYSSLLDKLSSPENNILDFVSHLRVKLEYKEKGSRRDETLREPSSS